VKVRLEADEVAVAWRCRIACKATFPGAVGRDEDSSLQLAHLAPVSGDRDHVPTIDTADFSHRPRLPCLRARRERVVQEQRVQPVAPDRASPRIAALRGRHRRGDHGVASEKTDLAHGGTGVRGERLRKAEPAKQRPRRARDEFAAHLASWERHFLDDRHREAGARELERRRGARGPRADHNRIEDFHHGVAMKQ
jgi:hypothetical protein